MRSRLHSVLICALAVCISTGCSSMRGDPLSPGAGTPKITTDANVPSHQCWGTWDIACDTRTGEIETVPLRSAEFNANVVRFLQPPASPINMLTVSLQPGSNLSTGYLVLNITLRHPFFSLAQFRGFDVRGIILTEGGSIGIHDSGISYRLPDGSRLLNPDGYTRWWNQTEFTSYGLIFGYTEGSKATPGFTATATLNPYKLYADGLPPDAPVNTLDPDTRATFSTSPGINTRRYRAQFNINGTPKIKFKYAVDASWSLPDPSYNPDFPIDAYDLSANCQEPYLLQAPIFEEKPYWVNVTTYGGDAVFLLTIGDWQAKSGPDVLSQLSHVWVESPTLLYSPLDILPGMQFVSSTHPTQATFRCTIPNCHPTGPTGQQFLITAETADPTTYAPSIDGDPNAFAWPKAPLAAYALVDVPISDQGPVEPQQHWVVGLPDWCSLTEFCTDGADNLQLITNLVKWDLDGPYNDNSVVKWWEGHIQPTPPWGTYVIDQHVTSLGYTFTRTSEPVFDPTNCRMIVVVLAMSLGSQYLQFSDAEIADMKHFVKDGGVLCFLIENPDYFNPVAMAVIDQLGIPLGYGGYAQPPSTATITTDITPDYLTSNMQSWQYWTCGKWVLNSPDCVSLIRTPTGEHVVVKASIEVE